MSNFVSLSTALSALRSAQTGIDVAAHNISNANTAGYTRQRVNLAASSPIQMQIGSMGTGVTVEGINRIRDTFLDMRLHASNSNLGALEVKADLLARTESLLGEPEFGITKELNEVWAAFDELSLRPTDKSVRLAVLTALDTLAGRTRTVSASLSALGADVGLQLKDAVAKANDELTQLADLNRSIASIQGGGDGVPNDLLDRRDVLVDSLSRTLGVTSTYAEDGSVKVNLSGFDLVSGPRVNLLSLQPDNTIQHTTGTTLTTGGRIRGLQDYVAAGTGVLAGVQARMESFVNELVTQINTQHDAGIDANGNSPLGPPAVNLLLTGTAATLAVGFTDPNLLAAATPGAGGLDGTNALALGTLRTVPITGRPLVDEEVRGMITDLGAQVASARRQAAAEEGLNAAASAARRDHSAVSLDEEMVALMTFQRSYEAAARVATAVDEAISTVINRLGLVGR